MSVIHRVYLDDPNVRPQTVAHHLARYDFASDQLPIGLSSPTLDLMCGSGYGAEILSGYHRVIGIDSDVEAIDYARRTYSRSVYFSARAQDITVRKFFSSIVWFEGIEHVTMEDGYRILARCADALVPGGTLIVSTPRDTNEDNPWHLSKWSLAELIRATSLLFPEVDDYGQDWDTAAISPEDVAANDFYILVCSK